MSEQEKPIVEEEEQPRVIDPKEHERAINDLHKFKRQASDSAKQLEDMQSRLKQIETEDLVNQQKYKELYEATAKERDGAMESKKEFANLVLKDKKLSAIREHALKLGISEKVLPLLDSFDTSSVVVETTSEGRFNVLGADIFVQGLREQYGETFFPPKAAPIVNNSLGTFDGKAKVYTALEMLKLQTSDPAEYRKAISEGRVKRS